MRSYLRGVAAAAFILIGLATAGFEFTPTRPGEHRPEVRSAGGALLGLQVIRVEPAPEGTS
jgi:hypothetical protein